MDFGDFKNNQYYEYDGQPNEEPTYGTSEEEDLQEQSDNLLSDVMDDIEPTDANNLIPNGTHLCIKSGTYAEMITNQVDFLPKELLFCYDRNEL